MFLRLLILIASATLLTISPSRTKTDGCIQRLTPESSATVQSSVRAFVARVAQDITKEGPGAWNKEFSESPAFFMASEGQLAFPNRASATKAIAELARSVQHIELQWGDDIRVDPLTDDLAIIGCSYHEVRVETGGRRWDERGYFTALAEQQNGTWQFRNAHWSVVPPSAK